MIDAIFSTILGESAYNSWNVLLHPVVVSDYLRAIIIFVGIAALSVFTFYLFLRHYGMLIGHTKEASVEVYPHENLPRFQKIFSQAKKEIWLQGITLESLNHVIPAIESAIRQNKRVRILTCDPETPLMPEIENVVVSVKTVARISATLGMLRHMRDGLGDSKNNMEIRVHRTIPTQSLIIVDQTAGSGFIQMEPYAYHIPQQNRRIFIISQEDQNNLFGVFCSAYDNAWNAATTV